MRIYLSAIESWLKYIHAYPGNLYWHLISFYTILGRTSSQTLAGTKTGEYLQALIDRTPSLVVDSGAHSVQEGLRLPDWDEYTARYCRFIEEWDQEKVLGFFEMDIDLAVGYERVLELRRELQRVTDKVIPVWHRNRGIREFTEMCREYRGKIVAISGFLNQDIRDDQYILFLKKAWEYDCRLFCLGMTRREMLDRVPFDYVDSSSWLHPVFYGRFKDINGRQFNLKKLLGYSVKSCRAQYDVARRLQQNYYRKWRHYERQ